MSLRRDAGVSRVDAVKRLNALLGEWTERAACRAHPVPEMWDGDDLAAAHQAKAICRGCPVRAQCAAEADEVDRVYGGTGIWGGRSPAERAARRRWSA